MAKVQTKANATTKVQATTTTTTTTQLFGAVS
jgi:hypothetical protein